MSISLSCKNCSHVNSIEEGQAGKQIRCSECKAPLDAPSAEWTANIDVDVDSEIWESSGEPPRAKSHRAVILAGIVGLLVIVAAASGALVYFAGDADSGAFKAIADRAGHGNGNGGGSQPLAANANISADAKAAYEDAPESLTNSIGMQLVLLPPAEFSYDREAPSTTGKSREKERRTRSLPPFYVSAHEVTQDQYKEIMGVNPSVFRGGNQPVGNVTWQQALRFCRKLSIKEGVTYRLPTDAEWEYACRAGTTTDFHYGDSLSSAQANFDGNWPSGGAPQGVLRGKTTVVGSFKPNAFGLYDVHGNVWEWCMDMADTGSANAHVLRGGGGGSGAVFCRSSARIGSMGTQQWFGFRVVRTVPIGDDDGAVPSYKELQPERVMARIKEKFNAPHPILPPGVLILPVVDEHGRCMGAGPALSLAALGAATYSAPAANTKKMDISPSIVRLLYHTDKFLRRGNRITGEMIETMQACTGTQLYALPKLVELTEQPDDARQKGRLFRLTVEIRGGKPDRDDRTFEHELGELQLLQIPELMATDVSTYLDLPHSAGKLAALTEPPPSQKMLGGLNEAGIVTPRILLGYNSLSKYMAEMHNAIDIADIKPQEIGRAAAGWEYFLISGTHMQDAEETLTSLQPPLLLDSLKVPLASNLLSKGKFHEALDLLMELAPTHRGDTAYHTVMTRLAIALGEPELIDFALQTWTEHDISYAGKLRRGQFLVDLAWDARGAGYAHTVTNEGWRLFGKRLKQAKREFEGAIAMNDRDWKARSHLIIVAKGLNLPMSYLLKHFEGSVQSHPASLDAYYSVNDYLQPKWHGHPSELFAFGKMCVESGLWSDEIPQLFESSVTLLATDPDTAELNKPMLQNPAFRAALKSYFDESHRHFQQPQNINVYYGLWGALAGRYDDVAESFKRQMDYSIRGIDVSMTTRQHLHDRVLAHTATGAEQTAALIRLHLAASRFDAAEKLIGEAAAASTIPGNELDRYRRAIAMGRQLFEKRELAITPQQLLETWKLNGEGWGVKDNHLVKDCDKYGEVGIVCPFGFGPAHVTGLFEVNDKIHSQVVLAPTQAGSLPVEFHVDHKRMAAFTWRNKKSINWGTHVPGSFQFDLRSTKSSIHCRLGNNELQTVDVRQYVPGGIALKARGVPGGRVKIGTITIKLLDDTTAPIAQGESTVQGGASRKPAPREVRRFGRPGVTVETFALSPDKKSVCVGFVDGAFEVYDVATGEKLRELLREPRNSPSSVAFTPDGQALLIATHRNTLLTLGSGTGKIAEEFYNNRPYATQIFDAVMLPGERPHFLTAADDGVRLWDASEAKLLRRFSSDDLAIHSIACSPNGTQLLLGRSNGTIQLLELKSGDQIKLLEGHRGPVECVRFSADGRRAVSGARLDTTLRLWDLSTGESIHTLEPHHSNISAAVFSSDGSLVLSGGGQRNPENQISPSTPDTRIQLWTAQSGKLLLQLEGHEFGVSQVEFLPEDKTAISAGGDGMLRIWNLDLDD